MNTNQRQLAPGAPYILVAPGALALVFLIIPLVATVLQVDFGNLFQLLATDAAVDALQLSLITCTISTLICVVLGVPLALALAAAKDGWFPRLVRTLVTLPMVLPPVVAGLALLITWGRRGLLGRTLSLAGIEIGFTSVAVVLAQTFVALPFLVTSLEGSLRTRGFEYEQAAKALGASNTRTLFAITLPLSAPGIMSATALAFSRCLGEFGATITFAGSLQGVTRTLPLEIYLQTESDIDLALALSLVLVVAAFVLVGLASSGSSWWYQRIMQGGPFRADETASRLIDQEQLTSVIGVSQKGPGIKLKARIPERRLDVDLIFEPGSRTAILGPNGSGKSTILSLIAGTLTAPEAQVTWTTKQPPKVAFLAQKPALFPHLSVFNNVLFGLKCQGVAASDAKEIALTELMAMGVESLKDRRPGQLSGGQAQRVAIARAMAIKPELVLLDEPMAALDVDVAEDLRTLLDRRIGLATMVLVTHDIADVISLKAEVISLRRGKVICQGTYEEIAHLIPGFQYPI